MYNLTEVSSPFGGTWWLVDDCHGPLGYFPDEAVAKDFLDMLENE